MNLAQFKVFVADLIRSLVAKADAEAAGYKTQIVEISAKAAALEAANAELVAAIAAKDTELTDLRAKASVDLAKELNDLTTELEATFNPTPVADAVSEAVEAAPEVPTPPVVETAIEVGTTDPTPVEVVEAAIEAVVQQAL